MIPLWKANLYLRAFGTLKVPLIGHLRTRIVSVNEEETVVKVPLGRRSKNHLGSLYFGALAVGADVAAGWAAMAAAEEIKAETGRRTGFVFKDSNGEYLRRPDGDTHFTCSDNRRIRAAMNETLETGERVNVPVTVTATVPKSGPDPVARFGMTLSLKAYR